MLNLIRKDLVLHKYILIILLPFLLLYLFVGNSTMWVGIVFCIVLITQAFATDEKSSTHLLMNSLPYTRKEIVSSKYIGACVIAIIVLGTLFLGHFLINGEIINWKQLLIIFSIVALYISFAFPFSYLFKSEYLLIAFIVLFACYLIIINLFIPDLNDRIRSLVQTVLTLEGFQFYLIVGLSTLVLYIVSWVISIRIYSRKVF